MAHHEAISKARWLKAQKREIQRWQGKEALEQGLKRVHEHYMPVIRKHAQNMPKDAHILEIGCGPASTAQFIEQGSKTYVDPLLDDFRRAYPGKLPKGEHQCRMAENIDKPDACFDLILCFDALDHAMNPELVISEAERLLKEGGIFIVGITTCPAWLSRLRYFLERFFPPLRDEAHPYFYSRQGIEKTLKRHFNIAETHKIDKTFTLLQRQGWAFVCKLKEHI